MMDYRNGINGGGRAAILLTILIGVLVAFGGTAHARSTYLSSFNTTYGTSATVLNTCSLCHPGGNTGQFNPYGNAYRNNARSFATIEPFDSDGDGFTNIAEITARTFPGDAASRPGPSDTTPPTVSSTNPAGNATAVAVGASVAATFSEALNATTVTTATFTLRAGAASVAGTVTYSGTTATFRPSASLSPNTVYTATITTGVRDVAGNALAAAYNWNFTTGAAPDTAPPTVISTNPPSGAGVAVNTAVTATFSEAVNASTLTAATFTLSGGGASVAGTVSASGATATFTPSAILAYTTTYTATITTGVRDLAGNALAANYAWTFTTGPAPDVTPPTVSSTSPVNGATGVGTGDPVTATFSEAVNASTVTTATFTLRNGAASVAGTVTLTGTTAAFRPSAALAANTAYTATVTTGVRDLAGNAMAANRTWTFTTGTAPDTAPPTVSSTNPAGGATGVAVNTTVTAAFSEPIDTVTVTPATFTLRRGTTSVSGTVSASGAAATFRPAADLLYNTAYTATVTTGVRDAAGNALSAAYSWTFTTSGAPDTAPPTISSTTPAHLQAGVPVGATLAAVFSETMDPSSLTTATFVVEDRAGHPVAGVVGYAGMTATFTPSVVLANGTEYTATVTTGARDSAGNALAAAYTWSFVTIATAPDTDGDGVPDNLDAFPNDPGKATAPSPTGNGSITVDTSMTAGARLSGVYGMADTDPLLNQKGKPAGYEFRSGMVAFKVTGIAPGATATVKVVFPGGVPAGARICKVDSAGFYEFPVTVSGNTVTLTLTDGGAGDADGAANGVIDDPVGVATPVAASNASSGGGCSIAGKGGNPADGAGAFGILILVAAGLLSRRAFPAGKR